MIKIINFTNLYYKELGEIIDNIQWDNRGETNYVGKKTHLTIKYKRKHVEIDIEIMKKCVKWTFYY